MGYFSSSGSGTSNHAQLTNRNAADQHPITAITGLAGTLAAKAETNHTHEIDSVTGLRQELADANWGIGAFAP